MKVHFSVNKAAKLAREAGLTYGKWEALRSTEDVGGMLAHGMSVKQIAVALERSELSILEQIEQEKLAEKDGGHQ